MDLLFTDWDSLETIHLDAMDRKIYTGKNVMLVRNSVKPKAVVPAHKHPHEQMLYVVSGECDVTSNGVTKHLSAGGLALFPSNMEHAVVNTLDEELVAIDIFSPIREDFLK
ncbi:hypothetical protein IMSAG049_01418 [Clostridiales bacterium]|nr:hypothetical protein IMSAG049_01418 [Clostridiales bacterium]